MKSRFTVQKGDTEIVGDDDISLVAYPSIPPPLPRPKDRRVRWQENRVAKGLCRQCGKPRGRYGTRIRCLRCNLHNQRNRTR